MRRPLAPEDLRLRFFSARRELARSELARLVQIDYAREMAFIALALPASGDTPELLGVVRAVCDPDNLDAEFAIVVRSDLKGRGLGTVLLQKMLRYLHGQGTRRLVAEVLRENDAMRGLARRHGMHPDASEPGGESVRYLLDLQAHTL